MSRTSHETKTQAGITKRLLDGSASAEIAGCSLRHWLRMAGDGRAPKGVKLGALRRWDLDEIERWIEAGCPAVAEGGAR